MFFHACRAGGCSVRESIILYLGVRIGALAGHVPQWQASMARDREGPRLEETSSDRQLREQFLEIAKRVLQRGEVDDPAVLEQRADEEISAVTTVNVRGK